MTSNLAYDTPAARRLRRIAPLVVLLGLMALIMAPGSSSLTCDRLGPLV
jgi:hypothetical protein